MTSDPNLARSFARLSVATVPVIVGDFVLHKKLGDGTRGVVKLANNTTKNETVACKIIRKEDLTDQAKNEILTEIELLQQIDHPNVIKLSQTMEEETTLNVFLEYAAGGSLKEFLRARSRLKEKEASVLFHQLVDGLEAIHKSGIIHRDLKSSNILLAADLEVKIADFKLATRWQEGQLITTYPGTLAYASPEIVQEQPYVGPEVDIWSIGVLLFEMLAGHRPFDPLAESNEQDPSLIQKNIIEARFTFPAHFSDLAQDLLKKILQPLPQNRLSLAEIKNHPWVTMHASPKLLLVSRSEPLNVLETRALVRPRRFSRLNLYLGRLFRSPNGS